MKLRRDTWDELIWRAVHGDYPDIPQRFEPGEVVLDAGCHTGAVTALCAARGARVVAYEAAFENFALARMNTREWPQVDVRWGALWRSDRVTQRLRFTPSPLTQNTGGGNVLFLDGATAERHLAFASGADLPFVETQVANPLRARDVPAVALDDVLREVGRVRMLKLDVEGAEFPILLTARELSRVELIVGEIHGFDDDQMTNLPEQARVGTERYDAEVLVRFLTEVGFTVALRSVSEERPQFLFTARLKRRGGE